MNDDMMSVGDELPKIAGAQVLENRTVEIRWRSGGTMHVDLTPALVARRIFLELRTDDALFQTMKVNEDGNALVWENGAELSALWLDEIAKVAFTNSDFRTVMDKLGVSLDGMAAMLDVSRRQIANYRKNKPIPRHIAYATQYLLDKIASSR